MVMGSGPSCTQFQAMWIEKVIRAAEQQKITRLEPKEQAVDAWVKEVADIWNASLFPRAKVSQPGARSFAR